MAKASSLSGTSYLLNNVAKDDTLDGFSDFTKGDLLANDAGGVKATSFFFGIGAASQADQDAYMTAHGIVDNHDGTFGFDISSSSFTGSFDYSVQTANGTWTTAHVNVAHEGASLLTENFDTQTSDPVWGYGDMTQTGWTNNNGLQTELINQAYAGPHITATSGAYMLDTQASPGGVDLSHAFTDATGGAAELSFDIGIQAFAPNYSTDPNAALDFKVDGNVVAHITYADVLLATGGQTDVLAHFDIVFNDGAAGAHVLEIVDVTGQPGNVGFALDSVQIHDWVI
jgi:hypothetical protein